MWVVHYDKVLVLEKKTQGEFIILEVFKLVKSFLLNEMALKEHNSAFINMNWCRFYADSIHTRLSVLFVYS